ncbi:hypothetical protein K7432_010397 [Basidiobolus ranarum]|uniref:Uncharacterized protein n=1 Tax=Basidiobolus ranarum TaxID=34480 RepID=A0ABR2WNU1_9FUNG
MDDEHAAALLAEKFTSPIRAQKSESMLVTTPVADREPVQAYAKLEGDTFSYFIRTLQVTLGRKAANSENADITLGTAKSISRHHAKVYYNFLNQRFELVIQGKNGAFINDQFVEKGATIPLEHRTKIQIGEVAFYFLLPKADSAESALPVPIPPMMKASSMRELSSVDSPNRKSGPIASFDDINMPDYTNVKPPYSYASLIAQAINSTSIKKMTLNGIYNYITSHYPYYQLAQNGWQNSIRHNLSLNKAFVKVPRADGEPGKGAFWTIDQNYEGQFSNGVYKRNRRSSKTSRENSASPFASPVKTRRKSVSSTSLEAGGLLSPVLAPPKFPPISSTTAPPPPPPIFFSNLLKDSSAGNPLESKRKDSNDESIKKEAILTPPSSQTYDCSTQEVKNELTGSQASLLNREKPESPIHSPPHPINLSPPASQLSEHREASEESITSNKQSETTEQNS